MSENNPKSESCVNKRSDLIRLFSVRRSSLLSVALAILVSTAFASSEPEYVLGSFEARSSAWLVPRVRVGALPAAQTVPAMLTEWRSLFMPQTRGPAYYVSTSGSDLNKGTEEKPWRTIQHGLDRVRPGETVYVRGGTYREQVNVVRSGTVDQPITISGMAGESVVLLGTGLNQKSCFNLGGESHLVIENISIRDYRGEGVRGFGIAGWEKTNDITLRNLNFTLVGTPIKIAANGGSEIRRKIVIEDITASDYEGAGIDLGPGPVEDVTIRRVTLDGITSGNNTASDAIAIEHGNQVLIEDVVVTGHQGDGIDMKADNVTIRRASVQKHSRNGIKLWGANCVLEDSWVSGSRTGLGALILAGAGPYSLINNVILNGGGENGMSAYSIELGPYEPRQGTPLLTVKMRHNTFHAEGNGGVLIYWSPITRLTPDSDYNTYFSTRTDAVFGAVNSAGKVMWPVLPADINNGKLARFMETSERHSRFNPQIPPPPTRRPSTPAQAVGRE